MTPLPVFLAAMFLLNVTPGPDMLYVLARATSQGRAAGLASALGVGTGGFFHIFAVAFGLAGLLRTVPVAYTAVRYLGAAYLLYLGVRTLLARGARSDSVAVAPASLSRIFAQGAITNVLNPNDPSGSAFSQTVRLGLLFDLSGTLINVAVAVAAGSVGDALRNRVGSAPVFRWLTGGIFIGLGLRLARRDA